jgi:hypothetical protein
MLVHTRVRCNCDSEYAHRFHPFRTWHYGWDGRFPRFLQATSISLVLTCFKRIQAMIVFLGPSGDVSEFIRGRV